MQFILRDIASELQDMSLNVILNELEGHRAVLPKIVNQGLRRKIENNISLLQCRKLELQRMSA